MENEKKSMVLYYTYRKTEFKHITAEQLMNIIMCLLELDETGKIEEEKDRLNEIENDPLAATVFDVMKDKTARASEEWWRLYNNRKKYKTETIIEKIIEKDNDTITTESGRVIKYNSKNESFNDIDYYIDCEEIAKMTIKNNELIEISGE